MGKGKSRWANQKERVQNWLYDHLPIKHAIQYAGLFIVSSVSAFLFAFGFNTVVDLNSIDDGKIVAGTHGAGGEIGHVLVVRGEAEKCNCGNHGCLEQYASATGIVRVAGRMLAASEEDSTLRGLQNITAKDVLDAFKEGDALAVRTMEYVGDLLGGALAGFAAVVDPEAIVIGGGVSKAGQPLIDCIQKYYMKYAFPSCKDTQIVLATLGNDAGICGAAKMVL